jgi:class 3 adenylate cyclase
MCFSQEENTFRLINLSDTTITFDMPWLYHPGDDLAWAAGDFPDQGWDTIATKLDISEKDTTFFPGIAWFRLHIQIDSSLMNTIAAISFTQRGASQIFHNGRLIKEIGVIGTDSTIERKRSPKDIPILLEFGDTTRHVLAIRYSNRNAFRMKKWFNTSQAGFSMNISDYDRSIRAISNQVVLSKVFLALFFIFVILGGLHFLLYIFFRENKANLFYSIFVLSFSVLIFWSYANNSFLYYPDFTTKLAYYISLLFPWLLVPLVKLLYLLFFEKTPKFFWAILSFATVLSILYFLRVPIITQIMAGYTILIFFEVLRVSGLAIKRKKSGSWIIGTGVIIFILFFLFIAFIILFKGGLTITGNSIWGFIFLASILMAIVSIPISMSVYLARDFARTNKNLKMQLENVKVLSAKTIEQEKEKQKILSGQKEKLEVLVKERTAELESEKEKTEQLLLNTLPLKVVNDLKKNGRTEPESFENVTVYFSDIVGFTNISTSLEPAVLISELNEIFTAFDDIMEKNSCERIKTIGDAYLAVCGMPDKHEDHAALMAQAALEIREYLEERNSNSEINWKIRIGLHSGKVVGGVVGIRKYIYDVFGDTINTTSRMESNSEPMRINVSETTYLLLRDQFSFTQREPMEIKGKGVMNMFFLNS